MDKSTIQDFIDLQASGMTSGRFEEISQLYSDVLPIFLAGKLLLIKGSEDLQILLALLREKMLASGAIRMKGYLTAGGRDNSGRNQFSVDWLFLDRGSRLVGTSAVTYYCDHKHRGGRIEMVEYQKSAFDYFGDSPGYQFPSDVDAFNAVSQTIH